MCYSCHCYININSSYLHENWARGFSSNKLNVSWVNNMCEAQLWSYTYDSAFHPMNLHSHSHHHKHTILGCTFHSYIESSHLGNLQKIIMRYLCSFKIQSLLNIWPRYTDKWISRMYTDDVSPCGKGIGIWRYDAYPTAYLCYKCGK